MLTRLHIQNIALVDEAELLFDPGLAALTGETGAGKSVIVTALALALGERADREYIRHGSDQAQIEAEFDVSRLPTRYKKDFADYLAEGRLRVHRTINRDGNSQVRINGDLSSLSRLKELTAPIAEIVGQHAGQMLMNEDNHLRFLDYFASLDDTRDSVAALFARWEKTAAELRRVRNRRDELTKERELLLFQQDEIEKAAVRTGEEQELNTERKILDSARSLMESAARVQETLDGEDVSALQLLRQAAKEIDRMAEIDPTLEKYSGQITELDFQISEIRQVIEQYGASVPDDPHRLEEINERLDEIYRLKKKYGGSEDSILTTLDSIRQRLRGLPDVDRLIADLESQHEQLREDYSREALALSEARRKAAEYLQTLVSKELGELAIENGGFEFEFLYEDDSGGVIIDGRAVRPYAHGLEKGRLLFSANPGEPLKSLVKTASGGEISRVLLALKAAERKNQKLFHSLLVFDEVDAGIGGQTAVEVGNKLRRLSEAGQVVVITHLHQIARLADHHYVAEKKTKRSRSVIEVHRLDDAAKKTEIDRMVALPE